MQFLKISAVRCALCFIAGAACASGLFWVGFQSFYQPQLNDASVEVLRERLSEVGPLSAKQQKILADEMIRVRRYERKLRKRAAALDSLLTDTLELDHNRDSQLLDDVSFSSDSGIGGGVEPLVPVIQVSATGSVVSQRARLIGSTQSSSLSRRAAPENGLISSDELVIRRPKSQPIFEYPQDTLRMLDLQTERFARIPLGAPSVGRRSSNFGYRRSPFSGRRQFHKGIDFAVERRTPVSTTADGVVSKAGYMNGYGFAVIIDHQNGYETLYGHLSEIRVKAGDTVCRGHLIGLVGSTGRSTGPHVHYEIRHHSKHIDPVPFVDLVTFLRFV